MDSPKLHVLSTSRCLNYWKDDPQGDDIWRERPTIKRRLRYDLNGAVNLYVLEMAYWLILDLALPVAGLAVILLSRNLLTPGFGAVKSKTEDDACVTF